MNKILGFFILTTFVVSANADELPLVVSRAKLKPRATWLKSAVITATPEDRGYLSAKIDWNGTILSNDQLISKMTDPETSSFATAYESSVEMDPKTFSIIFSSWRNWGTSMWEMKVWVAERNNQVVMTGLNYAWSYREDFGRCEVNFLTGKAIINGKAKTVEKKLPLFESTTDADLLTVCDRATNK